MTKYSLYALTLLFLGFLGLANAVYLVQAYSGNAELNCSVISGCAVVAESPYSVLFGMSLPSLGVVFFLALFVGAAVLLILRSYKVAALYMGLAILGFIFSLYFIYLQFFVIGAVCVYCLISAVVSTLMAGFSVGVYQEARSYLQPKVIPIVPPMFRP